MRPISGSRCFLSGGLRSASLLVVTIVGTANLWAGPDPRVKRGFHLFAKPIGAITINRVYCGIDGLGNVCLDSTNNGNFGGGFWPRGTANQYVYNSGLQLAGVIGADGGDWAGDTTGAFFFEASLSENTSANVRPVYNFGDPNDRANWPAAARIPCNQLATRDCTDPAFGGAVQDAGADIFDPVLQGRPSASQGDVWVVSWEGDPSRNPHRRPHPLGIVAETRGLGWNYPKGNEDIVYFVTTFYNVTARTDQACGGCYGGVRPAMRDILLEQAQQFHALNNGTFGVTLPEGGYTMDPLYAAFASDMDVVGHAQNLASVILPFSLGFMYEPQFSEPPGWTFDPTIFGEPFFKGSGLAGVKYLKGPSGSREIELFATPSNAGGLNPFGDPLEAGQLFRYLSGNLDPLLGDDQCNTGDPKVTHVCWVWPGDALDLRFFQSSPAFSLRPGEFASVVVAYVFAPPVAGICDPSCNVNPGEVLAVTDPMKAGDSSQIPEDLKVGGYLGWSDIDADGVVEEDEFDVVPGSLLGKALTAQAVFDGLFLLPFSPGPPDFFLIPGDDQVTVMWRPSPSEIEGDPFFQIASQAQVGGVINTLYDPNFREFDVEGYRIYRGRVNNAEDLTLVAQFDYDGTVIMDYGGQVNPTPACAPELNVVDDCPALYNPADFQPGIQRTVSAAVELNQVDDLLTQVKLGERGLYNGVPLVLVADTAVIGSGGSCLPSACPPLEDTGVPFMFVDQNVRNNFRYFYAVTAFDINSWQSGPTNLESARITKSITPTKPATNYVVDAQLSSSQITGRGVVLDHTAPVPTLDSATGTFSGPMPPSDGWTFGLPGLAGQVIEGSGVLAVRLDSLVLGAPYDDTPLAHQYWYTASVDGQSTTLMLSILQPPEIGLRTGLAWTDPVGIPIDASLSGRFGGDESYIIPGSFSIAMEGPDYHSLYGRGCVNGQDGFATTESFRECAYNGSRWFDGPSPARNEVMAHPIGANVANFSGAPMTNFSNAGQLMGVSLIHNTQAYQSVGGGEMRPMEAIKSGARRAADFNVYWGSGGTIDSVIDVSHNVEVPFSADQLGGTWGTLNPSETATDPAGSYDGRPELTNTDFHCVPPVNTGTGGFDHDPGDAECRGAVFSLSRTAVPGPVVPFSTGLAAAQTAPVWSDPGFGLYLAGDIFTFGLTGGVLPAAGTVWSLRTYIGAIRGGVGAGGNYGPYVFNEFLGGTVVPRSWTAVGTQLEISYDVTHQLRGPTADDIANVHPVPDPYYVTDAYEVSPTDNRITFINLPAQAIIRIYSSSGVLVDLIEHNSTQAGGSADWSVRNRNNQAVASGVYFYHVEASNARKVGRMTIVRYAP